ncbi:MAG: crossover junction endodeoxyribonuclease RuvC [Epsilonproteobacteria bacterium]|nr:crossover junction endodeoxyribonuclease RuvC [Campylobacterota bacterium]|tara:strand:+ start:1690 stop:2175 length:486 start_codon:yes stop_codon:yes gene_type:complete
MIVLGIDPGFTITGFSIVCKIQGKDTVLDCGYLSLPAKKTLDIRIGIFFNFFMEKIKKFQITDISIETPFLGKNVQSFLKLGYLRGVLYLLANQNDLQLHEFSPREVKRAVTGFGGAQKEQVAQVLFMLFPKLPKPKKEDVTDAIAISLCGLWQQKRSNFL